MLSGIISFRLFGTGFFCQKVARCLVSLTDKRKQRASLSNGWTKLDGRFESSRSNHLMDKLSYRFDSEPAVVDELLLESRSYILRAFCDIRLGSHGTIKIRECPFCHPIKGDESNMWRNYVDIVVPRGCFHCFRCGAKGTFDILLQKLQGQNSPAPFNTSLLSKEYWFKKLRKDTNVMYKLPDQSEMQNFERELFMKSGNEALNWLCETRGLDEETLKVYRVGVIRFDSRRTDEHKEILCVTFPLIQSPSLFDEVSNADCHVIKDNKNVVLRVKARDFREKKFQIWYPYSSNFRGFFGWHTLNENTKDVVITEGEFDAMAVYQATKMFSISLPSGASLSDRLVKPLERFDTIILWLDNDLVGQRSIDRIKKSLLKLDGLRKIRVVRGPENIKDANQVLLECPREMQSIIDSAELVD